MAEVYWDLEWTLQQEGFAYCYDKRLYDRLKEAKRGRFASTFWPVSIIRTSWRVFSKITTNRVLRPSFRGRSIRQPQSSPFYRLVCVSSIKVSSKGHGCVYLCICIAARLSRSMPKSQTFYARLLQILKTRTAFREGDWSQIQPQAAWPGNWTADDFIAYAWAGKDGSRYIVVVNYASNQGQCRLFPPFPELRNRQVRLTDLMGDEVYDRDGTDMLDNDLYHRSRPLAFQRIRIAHRRWLTMLRSCYTAAALALTVTACNSIGPATVIA